MDLMPSTFMGYKITSDKTIQFYDQDGSIVNQQIGNIVPSHNNQGYFVIPTNQSNHYYIFGKDGCLLFEDPPHTFLKLYNGNYLCLTENIGAIMDHDYNIIHTFEPQLPDKLHLRDATNEYMILGNYTQYFIYRFNGEHVDVNMDIFQEACDVTALTDNMICIKTENEVTAYHIRSKKTLFEPVEGSHIKAISDHELLIYGNPVRIYNCDTGKMRSREYLDFFDIEWEYGSNFGRLGLFPEQRRIISHSIDRNLDLDQENINSISYYGNGIHFIEDNTLGKGQLVFGNGVRYPIGGLPVIKANDLFCIDTPEKQLFTATGTTIPDDIIITYYELRNEYLLLLDNYENIHYFTYNLEPLSFEDTNSVIESFPNGLRQVAIKNCTHSKLVDHNGTTIIPAQVMQAFYLNELDTVLVRTSDRLWHTITNDGQIINPLPQYEQVSCAGRFIRAFDGQDTYILDKNGNKLHGPVKGDIHYYFN